MHSIPVHSLVRRRQRKKQAQFQSTRHATFKLALGCAAAWLLTGFVGLFALGLLYANLVSGLPSLRQLPGMFDPLKGALMQPTRLYDRSGQHLLLSLENPGVSRRYLYIDAKQAEHFSPELIRVTLAALDPGYWQSPGFSLRSLTQAQPVTIPERLVADLLLNRESPSLRRALRMRLLAAQVVARYGHVQVLEWYLNSVSYGHLAYGAGSAAQLYLKKSVTQLDLPEAALLVAASQSPALNPLDAPAAAIERQQKILDQLLAQQLISPGEHQRALAEKLALAKPVGQGASPAAAFSQLALNRLTGLLGRERLERGGLRIITTLDYDLQLELSCLVNTQLSRLTNQPDEVRLPDGSPCETAQLLPTLPPGEAPLPDSLMASGVVYDPTTGQVLALLGDSTATSEGQFLSPRPPGSLLTPFVAVAGFARGMGPATLTWDIPSSLPQGSRSAELADPDGQYHGPVRWRMALANDYLAAQSQLLAQLGASSVWRLSGALGLADLADETSPDLIYQGGQVSPLEIAQAYGVFASQGVRAGQRLTAGSDLLPALVLYVADLNGAAVLDARQPETQKVVSDPIAYLVHQVLSDASARWPSLGYPNALEIGRPSGAKIGQVFGGRQFWTAGYTRQRVAVFWLGLPADAPETLDGRMAAGMWHALMQYANRSFSPDDWPEPPGITHLDVCDPSGLLPTATCPQVVREAFLTGSEPSAPDNLYQTFQINRETGRLATVFTPPALIEQKTFLVVPAQARTWAQAAKLPVPPEDYDAIEPPEPISSALITSPASFSYIHGQVSLHGTANGAGFQSYQVLVGQGLNPQSWQQVGEASASAVKDGVLGVWDTQGQAEGLYAVRLQVVRQDQTVDMATIQVTVDNTPPLVRVPYPITGQVLNAQKDRTIIFQAEASDEIGVQRLTWWVDGKQVGETAQAPYAFVWRAEPGAHVLLVRASDLAGNESKSEEVRFSVK